MKEEKKSLVMTLFRETPTIISVGGREVEVYFNKNKGTYKTSVRFVCEEDVHIKGPHIVKREREGEALEEKEI
jgi:hypothetical protein